MGARELARRQFRREAAGYIVLPVLYAALMAAGVFLPSPTLVLLSAVLVLVLLLQARSAGVAAAVAPRAQTPSKPTPMPRAALAAADGAFLRQVNYTVAASALGYLVFLGALDLHLRALAAGASSSTALLPGAVLAIGLIVGGRQAARLAAWRRVSQLRSGALPGLPLSGPSPRAFLDWRSGAVADG